MKRNEIGDKATDEVEKNVKKLLKVRKMDVGGKDEREDEKK